MNCICAVASGGNVTQTKGVKEKPLFPVYTQTVKQSFGKISKRVSESCGLSDLKLCLRADKRPNHKDIPADVWTRPQ